MNRPLLSARPGRLLPLALAAAFALVAFAGAPAGADDRNLLKIGRASCRERV
mgnify:CR=1 FL=1